MSFKAYVSCLAATNSPFIYVGDILEKADHLVFWAEVFQAA